MNQRYLKETYFKKFRPEVTSTDSPESHIIDQVLLRIEDACYRPYRKCYKKSVGKKVVNKVFIEGVTIPYLGTLIIKLQPIANEVKRCQKKIERLKEHKDTLKYEHLIEKANKDIESLEDRVIECTAYFEQVAVRYQNDRKDQELKNYFKKLPTYSELKPVLISLGVTDNSPNYLKNFFKVKDKIDLAKFDISEKVIEKRLSRIVAYDIEHVQNYKEPSSNKEPKIVN